MIKHTTLRSLKLLSCAFCLSLVISVPAFAATFNEANNNTPSTPLTHNNNSDNTKGESSEGVFFEIGGHRDGSNTVDNTEQSGVQTGPTETEKNEGTEESGGVQSIPEGFLIVDTPGGRRDGANTVNTSGQNGVQTGPTENKSSFSFTSPDKGGIIEPVHAEPATTESYNAYSLTLSGTRVNDLAQTYSNVVFDFGSTVVNTSSEAIKDLNLSDEDTVSINASDPSSVEVSVNNQLVDIPLQVQNTQAASSEPQGFASDKGASTLSSFILLTVICSLGAIIAGVVLVRKSFQKHLSTFKG